VNPWGFARLFNQQVVEDRSFYDLFQGRRLLVEGDLITAETQPMPAHAPLEQKSARVVALQLLKRARDISYRKTARKGMRCPPSIIHAAISLDAGPVAPSLVDEVIHVATTILARLRLSRTETVTVFNPAYEPDEFTDRWPGDMAAQLLHDADLQHFIEKMTRLKSGNTSIPEKASLLREVFGESVASTVMENFMDARRHEMEAGRLYLGERGKVLGSAAAVAAPAAVVTGTRAAARPATREGGGYLPE
jgi:hypothetical protein